MPATLAIIFVMLYLTFRRFDDALLIMASLPVRAGRRFLAAVAAGTHLSIASAVGFIALAGVAAEFGVVMLALPAPRVGSRIERGATSEADAARDAIDEGAVLRVRPKAMTVAVIVAGLLPIMLGSGTGSEVMQRIAAPMVGGMVTAPILSMLVLPAAFYLVALRIAKARRV